MVPRPFEVDFDETPEEVTITLAGDLDRLVAERLIQALRDAELSDSPRIVIDVAELNLMDSAGLALVLQGARRAAAAGRRLVVTGPQPPVRRLLEIAAMGHLIEGD